MNMIKKLSWISRILFTACLILAFVVPYRFLSSNVYRIDFSEFFIKYSLIVLPVSVIWLGLILTAGNFREINKYGREIVVFVAIFLVASFCFLRWTKAVNYYGIYPSYVKNAEGMEDWLRGALVDSTATSFEQVTIYREAMESIYDMEFRKMWTFSGFIFLSAFLLLKIIPKKSFGNARIDDYKPSGATD